MRVSFAVAVLVSSLLCGCSHARAPQPYAAYYSDYLRVLLIDLLQDDGWANRTRFVVTYTYPDSSALVMVSGKRPKLHRLSPDQLHDLVRTIKESGCLALQTPDTGGCDDCPSWDVLVRLNSDQNQFTFDELEPDCVKRILAIVRPEPEHRPGA